MPGIVAAEQGPPGCVGGVLIGAMQCVAVKEQRVAGSIST